jgi:hypothetical protein
VIFITWPDGRRTVTACDFAAAGMVKAVSPAATRTAAASRMVRSRIFILDVP